MTSPSHTPGGTGVDSADLSRLAADLKKVGDRDVVNELRRGVRVAAEPVKRRVQSNAAGFSTRIPGAVRIRARYPARGAVVEITVDPKKAPHGAPINNKGKAGTFRHPVYGERDVWVDQPAVPFFDSAEAAERAQVELTIAHVMDDIARKAGFR